MPVKSAKSFGVKGLGQGLGTGEKKDPLFNTNILLIHADGSEGAGNTAELGTPSYKAFKDSTSNNHEIIVKGNAYGNDFSPYKQPEGYWSIRFNGSSNQYLLFTGNSTTDFNLPYKEKFTVEFWIYLTSTPVAYERVAEHYNSSAHWAIKFDNGGTGKICIGRTDTSDNGVVQSANAIPLRQWVHIAFVNSVEYLRLYVDGSLSATSAQNWSQPWTDASAIQYQQLQLGNYRQRNGYQSRGTISNFRIVRGASLYSGSTYTKPTAPFPDPFVNGKLSFRFDNSGDYLQLLNTDFNDFDFGTGQFLIEGWIYYDSYSLGSANAIIGQTGWGNVLQLNSSGALQFYQASSSGNSGAYWITGTTQFKLGRWNHFALQRDSSGNLDMWVNGVREASTTSYANTAMQFHSAKGDITIHHWYGQTSNNAERISNLRIKNSAVYTSGASITVPTAPFTSDTNTKLLTAQSKRFIDESSNDHRISVNGNAHIDTLAPYDDGYWSNKFDGSDDYLSIADSTDFTFGSGDFTIECWVYWESVSGDRYVYGQSHGAQASQTSFQLYSSGTTLYAWTGLGSATATITANRWYHVAFVRQSNTLRLYLQGVQEGTQTISGSITDSSGIFAIGRVGAYNAAYFQGFVSNLNIIKGTAKYPDGTTFTVPTGKTIAHANTVLLTCQSSRFIDNSSSGHALTVYSNPTIDENIPFELLSRQTRIQCAQSNRFRDVIDRFATESRGDTPPVIVTATPFSVTPTGNVGSAFFAEGADDAEIKVNNLPTGTNSRCIEFWVYYEKRSFRGDTEYLVQYGATGGNQIFSVAVYNNNGFPALRFVGYSSDYNTGITLNTNSWNFISVNYDGSVVRHYVNGELRYTSTRGLNTGSHTSLWVNAENNGNDTYVGSEFYIADLAVYDVVKRTSNFAPPTSIVSDTSDTKVLTFQYSGAVRNMGFVDDSKYNNLVTRVGSATLGTFSPFSLEDGYWSWFFESNHPIEIADAGNGLDFGTGDFTIEFFAFEPKVATSGGVTNHYFSTNALGQFSLDRNASQIVVYMGGYTIVSTNTPPLNQWNHIAIVREGSGSNNLSYYLNGSRIAQASNSTNWSIGGIMLGGQDRGSTLGYHGFTGYLSNFRIVKSAVYSGASYSVPTSALTAITNTTLLTCQSNYIIDRGSNSMTMTTNSSNPPRVVAFSPVAPSRSYSKDACGGSVYLNGSSDRLEYDPRALDAIGAGDFTVEFWWYPIGSFGGFPGLFSMGTGGGYNNVINIGISNLNFQGGLVSGYSADWTTSVQYRNYQWHHLVLVRSGTGSNNCAFFVNGVRTNQFTDTGNIGNGATVLYVGSQWFAGNRYAGGFYSNVRVTNNAVYNTGNATLTMPTAPLQDTDYTLLLSRYDNGGIIDHTGKNNLLINGETRVDVTDTKIGTGSLVFDGSDYLEAVQTSPRMLFTPETGDMTWECFVKFDILDGQHALFAKYGSGSEYQFYYNNSGAWTLSYHATTNTWTDNSVSTGTWYHIALVKDGQTVYLFKDGTSLGTNNMTYNTSLSGRNFFLGASFNGNNSPLYQLKGKLDEIRVSRVARYTSNFSIPTSAYPNR